MWQTKPTIFSANEIIFSGRKFSKSFRNFVSSWSGLDFGGRDKWQENLNLTQASDCDEKKIIGKEVLQQQQQKQQQRSLTEERYSWANKKQKHKSSRCRSVERAGPGSSDAGSGRTRMLAFLFLINGFFGQVKSEAAAEDQDDDVAQSSQATTNGDASMSDAFDARKVPTSTSASVSTSSNHVARFQVGLSSGESADSLNNLRDDDLMRVGADAGRASQHDASMAASSKRRLATNRKKRHRADKDKASDDEDDDARNRRLSTPNSSRRQSATQLSIPSYAIIKQDRQFRLRTRKPLEVRSPLNLSCSPVRRNSTCNATENGGIRPQNDVDALRRRSIDIGKNLAVVQNESDENSAAKKVSFSAGISQTAGTGGLHRTLSTSVLRIKHRRSFWEKVIG